MESRLVVNTDLFKYRCRIRKIYNGVKEENCFKYAVINGIAHGEVKAKTKGEDNKYFKQDMTIFADGGLADYVESELNEGDKILVLGQLRTNKKCLKGVYYPAQEIQASEIYKDEWSKYY